MRRTVVRAVGRAVSLDVSAIRRVWQPRRHTRWEFRRFSLDDAYWEFASQSSIVDAVADLLGPNVKFHHSKLNFKAPRGGAEVKWHQDIQFWPHTNYDLVTVGVFLDDVEAGMGEVGFVSGSHCGRLFDLYDSEDRWVGALADDDLEEAGVDRPCLMPPTGPYRSIFVSQQREG
jgi:ectoine hydroxylase-related dioxygenase (phytanoyl-CoA dioxygenase family)